MIQRNNDVDSTIALWTSYIMIAVILILLGMWATPLIDALGKSYCIQ